MLHVEFEDYAMYSPASSVSDPQHSCSLLGLWRWISRLLWPLPEFQAVVTDLSWWYSSLPEVPQVFPLDSIRISPGSVLFPQSYASILIVPSSFASLDTETLLAGPRVLSDFISGWLNGSRLYQYLLRNDQDRTIQSPGLDSSKVKQLLGCCWKIPLFPASVMGLLKASACTFSGCWSVSEALRLTWWSGSILTVCTQDWDSPFAGLCPHTTVWNHPSCECTFELLWKERVKKGEIMFQQQIFSEMHNPHAHMFPSHTCSPFKVVCWHGGEATEIKCPLPCLPICCFLTGILFF